MTLTINRAALDKALSALSDIVDARGVIPILGHVRVAAANGCLSIFGTDLDMQMAVDVPCDGELAECCPNFATLKAAAASLIGESVEMKASMKDGKLTVTAGRATRTIRLLPVADYPVPASSGDGVASMTLPAADLRRALEFVRFSVSTEAARHYLCGVLFEPDTAAINFVATNGNTLQRFIMAATAPDGVPSVILPTKFVGVVCKRDDDHEAQLLIDDKRVSYAAGRVRITSKLIDGRFPDYGRVIPSANPKRFEANAEEVARAALAAASVSAEKVRAVELAMAKDEATFKCASVDTGGAAVEPVRDASWSESPMAIGFNAALLAGVLRGFGDRQVEVSLADASAPALITCSTLPEASAVIMPMRI